MSSQSYMQTQQWSRSFQRLVPFLYADDCTANVRVLVGGPFSVVKVYGRSVSSPAYSTADSVDPGDHFGPSSSMPRKSSAGASVSSYSPPPRTAAQNRNRHSKTRKTELALLINQNFDPRKLFHL